MIEVKLNDIINSIETFQVIMQQSVKGSLAFKIARLIRELNKEMETFNEQRRKILDEYCVKDENGQLSPDENGNIQIQPDKIAEFNDVFTNLLNTEIEINADKIPIDQLDGFEISPQQILNIEMFFEDGD